MESGRGALGDRNLLELLMEWHKAAATGVMKLTRKQTEKTILFEAGSIVRAQSNIETEKLGSILVKRNLISPWDLEVALSQVQTNQRRLGQVLLGMSALKEAVLNQTLVSQTRDILFSMLDWQEGEYVLSSDIDLRHEVRFEHLYTPEIILQGMRRISDIVLLLRPLGDLQAKIKLSPDYLERIRKVTLLTEEKSLLALLHKPSSLKELLTVSKMEKLVVYRSVAAMLAIGVLQQQETAPKEPAGQATMTNSGSISLSFTSGSFESVPAGAASRNRLRKQLGEMLVDSQVISEEQLKEALNIQSQVKGRKPLLGNILVQKGFATEDAIIESLSGQLNIRKLEEIDVSEDALRMIPFHLAKKYFVCPIRKHGSALEIAMIDPTNMAAIDDLSFVTGYRIKPFITTNRALKEAWEKSYQAKEEKSLEKFDPKANEPAKREFQYKDFSNRQTEEAVEDFATDVTETSEGFHFDVGELETLVSSVAEDLQVVKDDTTGVPQGQLSVEDAPIVKLVNTILRQAINLGASDIHIEPWENKLQVRFRMDGTLHKVMSFPAGITGALTSRVKIISGMDIAERRRPQDGRVKLRMARKRVVDYRVSVVPSIWGERVVLRVLDRASLQIDLTKLGFDADQLEHFQKAISQPYGLLLCTGPTGSGKTTTLYSALNSLDAQANNIMTAEDPVEYNFPGICQVQVNEQIGVTFGAVLRTFLRQDPDIMMVGEIRDSETAEICAKAALTGHLVLSTVHTNDAASATGRLIDLGLKPYLVSASLLMVIAQRLLRKICTKCKTEAPVDRRILIEAGFNEDEVNSLMLYQGKGCENCNNTGFMGRSGIYEIMPVTRRIKSAIAADLPSDQIKDIAVSEGMKDLRRAALEKVLAGVTTLEEAIQNTLAE
jgi:type IV pilus assembly protein PilB